MGQRGIRLFSQDPVGSDIEPIHGDEDLKEGQDEGDGLPAGVRCKKYEHVENQLRQIEEERQFLLGLGRQRKDYHQGQLEDLKPPDHWLLMPRQSCHK